MCFSNSVFYRIETVLPSTRHTLDQLFEGCMASGRLVGVVLRVVLSFGIDQNCEEPDVGGADAFGIAEESACCRVDSNFKVRNDWKWHGDPSNERKPMMLGSVEGLLSVNSLVYCPAGITKRDFPGPKVAKIMQIR